MITKTRSLYFEVLCVSEHCFIPPDTISKYVILRTLYFQVSWPPDTISKQVVPQTLYFKADCPLKRDTIYTKGGHFAYLQVKCLGDQAAIQLGIL